MYVAGIISSRLLAYILAIVEPGGVTAFIDQRLKGSGVNSFMAVLRVVNMSSSWECSNTDSGRFQCQGIAVRTMSIKVNAVSY